MVFTDHEEAESRMFIHAHYASENECRSCYRHLARHRCSIALFVSLFNAKFHRAMILHWHQENEKVHSDARHSRKTVRRNYLSVACISHSDGL